jgi:hypothetical protein
MAMRGRWMVDELSAPIHNPDPFGRQVGKSPAAELVLDRQYPAHGAHGSGTTIPVPPAVAVLTQSLFHYDPMIAEHLFWASSQAHGQVAGEFDSHLIWNQLELAGIQANAGTDPHLTSSKYTGHGIILRAGVGSADELSIHLDQVDRGPNYRWGDNGEGSCGVLYYYAGEQVWSGHERENTGDHYNEETVGETNFGFMKDGKYRCIGMNVLDRPMYDLKIAQFAELAARRGDGTYSWPQYDSRSVMLVGTDYFLLLDRTGAHPVPGSGRFSWFQAKDLAFPKLVFLSPLVARADHWTEVQTESSKGIMRDVDGSSLVLVTHRPDVEMEEMESKPLGFLKTADVRQYAWAKNSRPVDGVWRVKTSDSHDIVFRSDQSIGYASADGVVFSGTAGVVRHCDNGTKEMAIFQGSQIGADGLTLSVPEADEVGLSAVFAKPTAIVGQFYAPHGPSRLTISPADSVIYIDGEKQPTVAEGNGFTVALPAGRHHWELTAGRPRPMSPVIVRTENITGGAEVFFAPVAGAESYRLEVSRDGGRTWESKIDSSRSPILIDGLRNQTKVHVRLIAINAEHQSEASDEYPVYVTDQPPASPEGLGLTLGTNRADASWGQLLGVKEYRLYRRVRGQSVDGWKVVYAGLDHSHVDSDASGVVPAAVLPGGDETPPPPMIYEYAVTAVNGNGESPKSDLANTDPTSWRNWWPSGILPQFKRQSAYWLPPYVSGADIPPSNYP